MNIRYSVGVALSSAMLACSLHAADFDKHVLLISIDGMHAVDYENCVKNNTCPNLAALGRTGVNYTRTTTSRPSDSFPGLMALVTGGTPKSVGAFYDVAWDRVLAPPSKTTGNGLASGDCHAGKNNGTQTEYEEGDEINQLLLNGGGPYKSPFDGGVLSLDPAKFIRDPFSKPLACAPVYPWNFIRTNTIYGVIHAAGGYTAWSDKHAVYAAVSGPTGTSTPSNVDDYYSPEVNSNQMPLPGVVTAGTKFDCSTIQPSGSATVAGNDWTTDFQAIQCYDQLKVNAVLNWIHGKTHLGGSSIGKAPNIFGMNFQAVSVGQKLIENGVKGGYTDAAATPSAPLEQEIVFADAAVGEMVDALRGQGLLESTTIIVTAKHGQSPIDPHRFFPIPGHSGTNGTSPANLLLAAGYVPPLELAGPGPTEDDISQLWLSPGNTTATNTLDAVNILESRLRRPASARFSTSRRSRPCLTRPAFPRLTVPAAPCSPAAIPAPPISWWRPISA